MTTGSVITPEMRAAVNVESEPYVNEVEKGAIRRFAEAVGDESPLFNNEEEARKTRYGGIIATPTFFRSLRGGTGGPQVRSPFTRVLDGGSEWEFYEPVRPGDQISVTGCLADVYEREGRLGKMLFMVRETRYRNQYGKMVAVQRSTGISY